MEELRVYKQGEKIYLDKEKTVESKVNYFLDCRDGVVDTYEYRDGFGYGNINRLFLCENTKHEYVEIIKQIYIGNGKWVEYSMGFGSDEFEFLEALIKRNFSHPYGKYLRIRDY